MKKIILVVAVLSASFSLVAQSFFSTEPMLFLQEIQVALKETRKPECKELASLLKEDELSKEQLKYASLVVNALRKKGMAIYPYAYQYLNALIAHKRVSQDISFKQWNDVCLEVINKQKRGDFLSFKRYMDFSKSLFEQQALYADNRCTWKVNQLKKLFISYQDNDVVVKLSNQDIVGKAANDSMLLYNVEGIYHLKKNQLYGEKAISTWERQGISKNEAYCLIENFQLDLMKRRLTSPKAVLHNKIYLNEPILGNLEDKLCQAGGGESLTFPRFKSKKKDYIIDNIVDGFKLEGSIDIKGANFNSVAASGGSLVTLSRKNSQFSFQAQSNALRIKVNENIYMSDADVLFTMGDEHVIQTSGAQVFYDMNTKELRVSIHPTESHSVFYDSYHELDIWAEQIRWKLDSDSLEMDMLSKSENARLIIESPEYYSQKIYRKIQGGANYHPLSLLKQLVESEEQRQLKSEDLAAMIHGKLSKEQLKTIIYDLVNHGFIFYNKHTDLITVRNKTLTYALAYPKKSDYDHIKFATAKTNSKAIYDLNTNKLSIIGVKEIPIDYTSKVFFFPKKEPLYITENRDMVFEGKVYAGMSDIIGKKNHFHYDQFVVDFKDIDSFSIYVIDSTRLNKEGQPNYKKVQSYMGGFDAQLQINDPQNKSGIDKKIKNYPKFKSKNMAHMYMAMSKDSLSPYPKKSFYFEVDPFEIVNLNKINKQDVSFKGKLISGGIFEPFSQRMTLLPNYTLGFNQIIDGNKKMYGGKGDFEGKINFNTTTFSGKGQIRYGALTVLSDSIRFYPDSTNIIADTVFLDMSKTQEHPIVYSVPKTSVQWMPKQDIASIYVEKAPFQLYDKKTNFYGRLIYTPKELQGVGKFDWPEAIVESANLRFNKKSFEADSVLFTLKNYTKQEIGLHTPKDLFVTIDFENKIGLFKTDSIIDVHILNDKIHFNAKKMNWEIDEKILLFTSLKDQFIDFVFQDPTKRGLRFEVDTIRFDIVKKLTNVKLKNHITIAQTDIFTKGTSIGIDKTGEIDTIKNVVLDIKGDLSNYQVHNATIVIHNENDFKGKGEVTYPYKNQIMRVDNIEVTETKRGKKYFSIAKGKVGVDTTFYLNEKIQFTGSFELNPNNLYPFMEGYAKIVYSDDSLSSSMFPIKQPIHPDTLRLYVQSPATNKNKAVSAGIYLDKSNCTMYATLINPKNKPKDVKIIAVEENYRVFQDKDTWIYESNQDGTRVQYEEQEIEATGPLEMGIDLPDIDVKMVGKIKGDVQKKQFDIQTSMAIDFDIDAKLFERLNEEIIFLAQVGEVGLDQESRWNQDFRFFTKDDKEKIDIESAFDLNAIWKKPSQLDHKLVFTDLNMKMEGKKRHYRSVGDFTLLFAGNTYVNHQVKGYIEMGFKGYGDYINIYLYNSNEDWVFLSYKDQVLSIISSMSYINESIKEATISKKNQSKKKANVYMYKLGTVAEKDFFIARMKGKTSSHVEQVEDILNDMFEDEKKTAPNEPDDLFPETPSPKKQRKRRR